MATPCNSENVYGVKSTNNRNIIAFYKKENSIPSENETVHEEGGAIVY